MKTLYLDCNMGAAGDMLTAALIELLPEGNDFLDRLNRVGIPGVLVACSPSVKCGVTGSHISVTVNGETEESIDAHHVHGLGDEPDHDHDHEHVHGLGDEHDHDHHHHDGGHDHGDNAGHHHSSTGMHEIRHIVSALNGLSDKVRKDVLDVYQLIAEAEGHVHDQPVEQIHFSEVGTMDAVADIVAVCMLMEELAPGQIVVSPVHVGSGQVRCAHGLLPVPAPATAYILRGVPVYGGSIPGELCTPTGAALLKHFAGRFGNMPVMTVSSIGYGMGTKDFEAANCVRAFLGYTEESADAVSEICCNLDDMTPEAIGFVQELLFKAGALDVYTVPIGMKKSRPGILLCCISSREQCDYLANLILRHTTTLGVRISESRRIVLERSQSIKETPYGQVRIKTATGNGIEKSKPEYDDVAKIAGDNDMTISDVM
ncbi:MAG: nickel pincer cofactor biosynthesis protein LarC, partial [Eubacteriales bacterium]